MKPSAAAGWLVFIPMLFVSVFYLITSPLFSETSGAAAVVCTGVCIALAFGGTRYASKIIKPKKSFKTVRRFLTPRYYMPFVLWLALGTALLIVIFNIITAAVTRTHFWGLSGLYPMLRENMAGSPFSTFIFLVLIPSVVEERLLRDTVFAINENQGTMAALYFSALATAMMFVYPQAVMAGLIIGAVCAFVCHITQSLSAAMLVHFICRLALWLCDIASRSARFMKYGGVWAAAALFVFFICIYRITHSFEMLLKSDLVNRFTPGAEDATENLKNLALNAGFILFALTFLVRFISMIVTYA